MDTKAQFINLANSPKFNFFLLRKLPAAYFCGVRIKSLSEASCSVSVPFKWFSQNPFGSTYFACLAMAAELSTGALAMANVYKRKPGVSMLVLKMEAEYFKKAKGKTIFTCSDGAAFDRVIDEAIETREPRELTAFSEGRNESGELVATLKISWTFRVRTT
ncbi:DUF4442 domain-containing protein [Niabella insulamsoli]|uniref:DUF4442 domain-containing protein n=1 Tax=Niabella insulamsoli TaxID=3144874 RepID=UPI0031FC78EA